MAVSPELFWMAATAILTGVLSVTYTTSLVRQMGFGNAIMDGQHETPVEEKWAQRAKRAHNNAVENFVLFAPLAIGVHVAGLGTDYTALACAIYFFARLAHFLVYAFGLPAFRTVTFAIGVVCQLVLAGQILMA